MSSARMGTMRKINSFLILFRCFVLSWFFFVSTSQAADTLRAGEVMKDSQFLESSDHLFRLLFVSLDSSSNTRHLGIQYMYYKKMLAVWIANPENPLNDTTGVLNMTQDGNLVITDNLGTTSFTINSDQPVKRTNTSVTLLNSGNLVLRAGDQILWQSFDYLSDIFLPGMKLGLFELKTGRLQNRLLTSWVSPDSPAAGGFILGIDPNMTKQLVIWRRGVVFWRSGIWNGYNFSNLPDLEYKKFIFSYFSNEKERYFSFSVSDKNLFPLIGMDSFGQIKQDVATGNGESRWTVLASCGDAEMESSSIGCATAEPSRCKGGDAFPRISGAMSEWTDLNNFSLGPSDCKEMCLRNCSCHAYSSVRSDGTGCKFSQGHMLDHYDWKDDFFYIRNNTEISKNTTTVVQKDGPKKKRQLLIIGVLMGSLVILTSVPILCYLQRRRCCFGGKNGGGQDGVNHEMELSMYTADTSTAIDELSGAHNLELNVRKGHELPLFNFSIIEIATNHFSDANKLGQGGFGPVYKGKLVQGQEFAVKRLSRGSGQGLEEFKNEVILISKLQHTNLVRLLGCCIQGEERILIYEYLPNKSLDLFLFDSTKRALLDWKKRVCIIEGIAQGLLYLHKYSRLRIIHRDLKTSNILLDSDMNPKISDFGTARIFGEKESQANTNRIVGTYGYMSPEYAMDGLFSVKSDVFSFGVMMLEIISGKRNTGFYQPNRPLNLLGHAWDLYREEGCLELMDPVVEETCSRNEVMRFIQVGLLCVQESAMDRPTMSDVVSMLSNEAITLPDPKQPAFSTIVNVKNESDLLENPTSSSINDATVSEIETR